MFLRQSVRSDYCAPYATAAFLGLLGHTISRNEVLRSFRVRRAGWTGATYADIERVIREKSPALRVAWLHLRASSGTDLVQTLGRVWEGRPLLASANCLLLRHDISARHVFVIVAVANEAVTILDPLGQPPVGGQTGNLEIHVCDGRAQTSNHLSRLTWAVDITQSVSLMRWFLDD